MQIVFLPVQTVHAYSNPASVPLGTVGNFGALAKTLISSPLSGTVINNGDLGIVQVHVPDFQAPVQLQGMQLLTTAQSSTKMLSL